MSLEYWQQWILPISIIVGSFFVGLIFEWIIIKTFIRLTRNTRWKWDDVIAKSFQHAFIIWFLMIGITVAREFAPLSERVDLYTGKVTWAISLFVFVLVASRLAYGLIKIATDSLSGAMPSGTLLPNTARVVVMIVGIVFILNNFGFDIAMLLGTLGIGGLAAALAFQDTLSNLFSGFQMLASRKVRTGDFIELDNGKIGFVTDISWRETTLRDFNNNLIIVPNSTVSSSIVTNFNLPMNNIYVELTCGVSYDSDLEKVERVTREVAAETFRSLFEKDPEPITFFFMEFADSAITFKLKILVEEFGHRIKLKHPLMINLHKRFKQEGIDIPFPIRTLYHKNLHKADVAQEE
jgi:small-conductance mechanosensitive channel